MEYTFALVGVSPVLQFFNDQQQNLQKVQPEVVEYVGSHKCTLDGFIKSVELVPPKMGWDMDQVIGTVIKFWMNNSDSINYWKSRLIDAGRDNIIVARVADIKALQAEFESLLGKN